MHCLTIQGCGLTKITRSPKPPYHEILGAQHLSLFEKSTFFQLPKGACGTGTPLEHSPVIQIGFWLSPETINRVNGQ